MRIISQDGTLDLPYERFVISVNMQNKGEIIAWTGNHISDDECIVMAVYSSFAKAQKAMEMLREYKETKEIRSIPLTKSLMESFSNVKMENFEIYTDGTGDYLKVDIVKKDEYFQFPADEDVEV